MFFSSLQATNFYDQYLNWEHYWTITLLPAIVVAMVPIDMDAVCFFFPRTISLFNMKISHAKYAWNPKIDRAIDMKKSFIPSDPRNQSRYINRARLSKNKVDAISILTFFKWLGVTAAW